MDPRSVLASTFKADTLPLSHCSGPIFMYFLSICIYPLRNFPFISSSHFLMVLMLSSIITISILDINPLSDEEVCILMDNSQTRIGSLLDSRYLINISSISKNFKAYILFFICIENCKSKEE